MVITNAQGDERRDPHRELQVQPCQRLIGLIEPPARRRENQEAHEHGVVDSAGLLEMPRLEAVEELNIGRATAVLVAERRIAVSGASAHADDLGDLISMFRLNESIMEHSGNEYSYCDNHRFIIEQIINKSSGTLRLSLDKAMPARRPRAPGHVPARC